VTNIYIKFFLWNDNIFLLEHHSQIKCMMGNWNKNGDETSVT